MFSFRIVENIRTDQDTINHFLTSQKADWGKCEPLWIWSAMKISNESGVKTLFQMPFSGLGISLKACAEKAGEMQVRYSEVPECNCLLRDFFIDTAFTGFSGYELLLTLGREIRGR